MWLKQLRSDLGDDFRLVALDIRGHGKSDKPRDAYGDSQLWADDVKAIIDQLGLERPLLCGWSWDMLIICDYLRVHGE
jgi:non-heme chloroperoxidase